MWELEVAWFEPVIRGVAIYVIIFFLVRFMGKKQLAKFTPFDLVLLMIISEAIQNGISGDDHSITGSLISVSVIIAMNMFFNIVLTKFPSMEKFIDGQPVVIILNGKMFKKVLKEQKITEAEVFEALREHEVMNPEDVKCAILEKDGNISVIKYSH